MEEPTSQKHILIVEDEEHLSGVLHDEFAKAGFTVSRAKDGEEGLKAVEASKPDLILLDIMMPKMDGIAMLKKVGANTDLKNIPVVVLTNLSDTSTVAQALENGAYDYLVKSDSNPNEIVKRVREKLAGATSQ